MYKSTCRFLLVCCFVCMAQPAIASKSNAKDAVIFVAASVEGKVTLNGKAVSEGTEVRAGARIATGPKGHTTLRDSNQNGLYVGPNSRLILRSDDQRKSTTIELGVGKVWSFLLNALPVRYEVLTAHVAAGVRGTIFLVEATKDESYVCSCSGSVEVSAAKSGDFASVVTTKQQAHRGFAIKAAKGKLTQEPVERHSHTDAEAQDIMATLAK